MQHPILTCAATLQAELKAVADLDPLFLPTSDKAAALRELTAAAAQLAELRLRVLAAADDLATDTGARDAAAWLAAETLLDHRTARADQALAAELDRFPRIRAGLTEGAYTLDHARAATHVLAGLADLRDGPGPEVLAAAETELARLAGVHTPTELRRIGAHLLDVIAPEIAEQIEARRLADLERAAADRTRLSLKPLGDGTTRLSGRLPDPVATRLRVALESFAQPRIAALAADGKALPRPRLLGQALGQLLETLDPHRLPLHGGDATTVMVTIALDQLRSQLGTGTLEGTTGLSATEIRRLACTANLIPAVLGRHGEVLDLGRTARLFTPAQRKALRLRHPTCQADGCTVPARWCDAHHEHPWSHGGKTDLNDGALLCGHHHHRAHDPAYDTTRLPNGDYRFHRRT